jgi:hypothetical protein
MLMIGVTTMINNTKPFPKPPSARIPTHQPLTPSQPTSILVDEKPNEDSLTHQELMDQIIRTTLKPVHATDPNVLKFISNYNLCHDVKQAAKLSGLHANDGKHLINNKDVYECIQRIAAAGSRKFGYDAEEVVSKVKEILDVDPAELFNSEVGAFYEDINEIPPELRRAIKKLNVVNIYDKDPNGVIIGIHSKILKYEFYDKIKAAELLGSEKEIFKRKVDVTHDVGTNMRDTLLGRLEAAEQAKMIKARDVTGE